jgi:hypothetical protein
MLAHKPSCPLLSAGCRALHIKPSTLHRSRGACPHPQVFPVVLESSRQRQIHQTSLRAGSTAADLGSEIDSALHTVQQAEPYIAHSWKWRDHKINYAVIVCIKRLYSLVHARTCHSLMARDGALHQHLFAGSRMWTSRGVRARLWSIHRSLPEEYPSAVSEL